MKWWEGLGKDNRGSRPRCVLLVDGNRDEVAERLTQLVGFPGVAVSTDDKWMPYGKPVYKNGWWDDTPAIEVQLDKADNFISSEIQYKLHNWCLAAHRGARTPTWDIASTCKIMGKQGLLLFEAKAHENELSISGKKTPRQGASTNSQRSHEKISQAIAEANAGLENLTGNSWNLSRDTHYQLSNRFAWSWKLASLGVPVVLVYLGFLNAKDMAKDGELFESKVDWERVLKNHSKGLVDNSCWGKVIDSNGAPFIPLIRVIDQPFDTSI